nr:hypothetical protein 2 [Paracoccaceae bacterium]
MNHLVRIQKKLKREHKVQAYIKKTAYRGTQYELTSKLTNPPHGTYVYRGRTYTK